MVNQNSNAKDKETDQKSNFDAVSWLTISEHQQGQRIDNYLFSYLKGVPKSRVYRILRKGEVRVNKARVKPEYKLQAGDKLRLPPIRVSQSKANEFYLPDWLKTQLSQVVYEDDDIMVMNKPAGLAVHGGSGLEYGLIEAMRQLRPECPFLELVHRIDRETSGFILLAKSRLALNNLHQQFRRSEGQEGRGSQQGRLEKTYLAVLTGALPAVKQVNTSLRQSRDDKGMKRALLAEAGAEGAMAAKSTFMPLAQQGNFTFARILLYTGRMHQARAHAASIDLPILGDKIYGDWQANKAAKAMGVKRCLLHAERYQFSHPTSGKQLQFTVPLPADFDLVLKNYGLIRDNQA